MENYVVEVWNIEEDENEKLVKKFLGFWKGVDSEPTPIGKGTALQAIYLDRAPTDLTMRRVKGAEVVTLRVGGDPRDCLEFHIIPESCSKHLGEPEWDGKLH